MVDDFVKVNENGVKLQSTNQAKNLEAVKLDGEPLKPINEDVVLQKTKTPNGEGIKPVLRKHRFLGDVPLGMSLEDTVKALMQDAFNGKLTSVRFRGKTLYSDTVSFDNAFTQVAGISYQNFLSLDDSKIRPISESTVDVWIKKGHELISKDKWENWNLCVRIRSKDLYKGKDLDYCLAILEVLKTGDFEKAKEVMENQNYSGSSWNVLRPMVEAFSDVGEEFAAVLDGKEIASKAM